MKKGIIIPFFTEISMNTRLDLIKKAGFDTFMISLDKNHEKFTGPLDEIVAHCKKIGLELRCAHAPYKDPYVNEFWANSALGDEIEEQYLNTLKLASKYKIQNVVVHLHFENKYKLNQIGIERLKRLTKFAEQNGVNIAVENLYNFDELGYIFDRIKSDHLGMCFDSGHENFATHGARFLHKYGNRLKAVHIHDNNGVEDEHKTPFTGTINWQDVAKGFAMAQEVSLESEVKLDLLYGKTTITEDELLTLYKREYNALTKLERMIEKEKGIQKDL